MPNVLSPRDLVSRPDNMDETVLHHISTATNLINANRVPEGQNQLNDLSSQQIF